MGLVGADVFACKAQICPILPDVEMASILRPNEFDRTEKYALHSFGLQLLAISDAKPVQNMSPQPSAWRDGEDGPALSGSPVPPAGDRRFHGIVTAIEWPAPGPCIMLVSDIHKDPLP